MKQLAFLCGSLGLFYIGFFITGEKLSDFFDQPQIMFYGVMFLMATLECSFQDLKTTLSVLFKGTQNMADIDTAQWVIGTYWRSALYAMLIQFTLGVIYALMSPDDMAALGTGLAITLLSPIYLLAMRLWFFKPREVQLELMREHLLSV